MERNQLLKVLQTTFLMWILCILSVCGQERERIPVDTLWYFFSEADNLSKDSTGDRSSGNVYDVKIPEFQYKSPEAAAFKKYGDYQVNEYTGNPNITVPLYTLSYKDIEVPITLTYDASGIQVEQEASWVGLGWNLMVGGCINYVASGSVDPKTLNASTTDWQALLATGINEGQFYNYTTNLPGQDALKMDIAQGFGERDFFSVNILGKSFLFMVDPFTNEYIVIGKDSEKYKVKNLYSNYYYQLNNAQWKIIDANGYQYYFQVAERTNAYITGGAYTSTWNLTEIVTPEGSVVTFSYSDECTVNYRAFRAEQFDFVSESNPTYYPTPNYSSQYVQSNISVYSKYLTSVETSDQRVSFSLSSRNDLPNAKKLDKISVWSKVAQKTIREYNFYHSYFQASTVGGNYLASQGTNVNNSPEIGLRLKLDSLTESSGSTSLTTVFEYNENTLLPLKTSCAKDFWGYFNNKANTGSGLILNSNTLLPTPLPLIMAAGIPLTMKYRTLKGANRYCDGDAMQAAILTKITYPTKGYTQFEYEPHTFISTQKYPSTTLYDSTLVTASVEDNNSGNTTDHLQLNPSQPAHGTITVTFFGQLSNMGTANVTIYPLNPNIGPPITYDLTMASYDEIQSGSFTKTLALDLEATSYMLSASCPDGVTASFVKAHVDLSMPLNSTTVPVSTGGGLRIKSISNFEKGGALQDSTFYSYVDNLGNCSGKLIQPMSFLESKIYYCVAPNSSVYTYNILRLKQSSSDMPAFYSSVSGGTVGYSMVMKKRFDSSQNLLSYTVSKYTNNIPQMYVGKLYYFENFDNGNITEQVIGENPENNSVLRCVRNTYVNSGQYFRCNAMIEDRGGNLNSNDYSTVMTNGRYKVWIYPMRLSWNRLTQSNDVSYSGTDSLTYTTAYDYNTTNHRVKTETTNSSNSMTYITEYKYTCDSASVSPYNLMSDSTYYMINSIIEQSLSVSENGTTSLIKKRKETYTAYNNKYRDYMYNSYVFLPTATSFALNGGSLEQRLTYVYNDKCDRISITKDSEKVTYLWAYNYMYPVAEIKGATYSDLTGWGLTTQISNLATMTNTSNVLSALATIRSSLASRPVLMTSYTYDPLVGITSMTTPNGTKTTYNYDVMGRLSSDQNHGNNTVQQHSYHYK